MSLLTNRLSIALATLVVAACATSAPAMNEADQVTPVNDESGQATEADVVAAGEDDIVIDTEPMFATLFTTAQAEEGGRVFGAVCAECHDAAEFSSSTFLFDWEGATVAQLYRYISQNMPDDNAGGLDEDQYEAVMAYILSRNGYPAGLYAYDAQADRADQVPFQKMGG